MFRFVLIKDSGLTIWKIVYNTRSHCLRPDDWNIQAARAAEQQARIAEREARKDDGEGFWRCDLGRSWNVIDDQMYMHDVLLFPYMYIYFPRAPTISEGG